MEAAAPAVERRTAVIKPAPQLIRLKDVMALCGISRSSIYDGMKKGEFPACVKAGGRSSAWVKSEIDDWISGCIRASRMADRN